MVHLPIKLPIVLVHGGLYEDMTVDDFWGQSGVLGELRARHLTALAPQRPSQPASWSEEATALLAAIDEAGHERVAVVGASNGCSAALRLAIDHPDRVARILLAWPATAGDPVVDEVMRVVIADASSPETAAALLAGGVVRGVNDTELAELDIPTVIYPPLVESQSHQRRTLMGILSSVSGSFMVAGGSDPLDADFADHLDTFVTIVEEFSRIEYDD